MNCAEPFRCGGVITAVCCAVCPPFRIFRTPLGSSLILNSAADDTDADCLRERKLRQRVARPIAMVLGTTRVPLIIETRAHLCFVTEYFQVSGDSNLVFIKEICLSKLLTKFI